MPDAAQDSGQSVIAEATAPANPEIVALEKRLNAAFDKRVAGFQRVIAERDAANKTLSSQLEDLQSSSLSPDEKVAAAQQRLANENAQLKAQIELAELQGEYGSVMDTYRQLLAAGSAKDQLELIKAFSVPAAPATVPEAEIDVPEIDFNNPQRPPVGNGMTEAMADRILGSVGTMASVTQNGARSYSQSGTE